MPCPQCGLRETECFDDFVSQAARSAFYNFRDGGSYMPMAWGCFGLADNILMFLFQILDGYLIHGDGQSFDDFAAEFVRNSRFEDSEYLRDYMVTLTCRVYGEMENSQEEGP